MNESDEILRYKALITKNIVFKEAEGFSQGPYAFEFVDGDDQEYGDYSTIVGMIESAVLSKNNSLLDYFLNDHPQNDLARKYFMIKAMKDDNDEIFKYLQLSCEVSDDYKVLKFSISLHNAKYTKYLLKNIDVNVLELNGFRLSSCPLYEAVKQVYPNSYDERYKTNGQREIIEMLLENGADPNIDLRPKMVEPWIQKIYDSPNYVPDPNYKEIPLIIDLLNERCHCDLLTLFLKYNTDINHFDLSKYLIHNRFLFWALNVFIQAGYNFSGFFDNYKFGFDQNEVSEQVERFLPDAPIETIDYILRNAKFLGTYDIKLLYYAAMANRFDVVRILIDLGAKVSGLKAESLAKIFYSGAPKYRSSTRVLRDNESIAESWYSNKSDKIDYWDLTDKWKMDENNRRLLVLAKSLLNSFSDRLVHYLVCYGASPEWDKYFPEVLKIMILREMYVTEGKANAYWNSIRELSHDGWNAAFEISSRDGDYHDYL